MARPGPALACLLTLLAASGGCGTPKLESDWLGTPIVVDGDASDWKDTLYALEDGRFMVGARNDDAWLYLCLGTADRAIRHQVLRGGFTLWLDPSGGKEKTVGLRCSPRAVAAPPGDSLRGGPGGEPGTPPHQGAAGTPPHGGEGRQHTPEPEDLVFQFREPGGLWSPVSTDSSGIELRLADTDETVACELRIPLSRGPGRGQGIGAAPGRTLGIGIETAELPRHERGGPGFEDGGSHEQGGSGGGSGQDTRPGEGGEPDGGDPGGWDPSSRNPGPHGPGGGWSEGGGRGRGRPAGSSGPLHLWATLQLAYGPGSAGN